MKPLSKETTVQSKIHAEDIEIAVIISLTDIARYRNLEAPGYVIQNWLRNRSIVDFLGLWEQMNNPNFNCLEFEAIKSEAGENCLCINTPKVG